jgi:hypothetical protein
MPRQDSKNRWHRQLNAETCRGRRPTSKSAGVSTGTADLDALVQLLREPDPDRLHGGAFLEADDHEVGA